MPRVAPSMRSALYDLRLNQLTVIRVGEKTFPLEKNIRTISMSRLLIDIEILKDLK
jgi:hypothetical protein